MRSSKPSPVEPNSKKELELAKQLQKENHYKGFTSEDENTTCENPDDYLKELDEKVKSMIAKSEKKMRRSQQTSRMQAESSNVSPRKAKRQICREYAEQILFKCF